VVADFLDAAANEPSALVIEGQAGIGKTTLWVESVRRARERGFTVLVARAAMAESVLAYTVLADLLDDLDAAIWADLPASQLQGLDAVLLPGHLAADTDQRAVAAAFLAVVDQLAAQGPVLVAIDDFQWLDTSSANVVFFAARRLPVGAALLCTTRTDEAASRLQLPSPDAVRRIRLAALTVGELHQVLRIRLSAALSRPALLRVHEISGGNPFFAVELAREITTRDSTALVGLPASLADLVRSRVGQAGTGAEGVLLAVASLADPTLPLIAQATDITPDRLIELLADAETQGVIAIDGNRVRFTHPLLAHGVYSAASARHRRGMHRRLAELVTEPELRARHLALSDPNGEPQTLEALDTAAEIARSRGAPAAAAELIDLAIDLGGDTPERRIRCAAFHFNAGDAARARTELEAVVAGNPPGVLRAEALILLGVMSQVEDSLLDAAAEFRLALASVGENLELRARILTSLAWVEVRIGRFAASAQSIEDAVSDAEQVGHAQLLSEALGMYVVVHVLLGNGWDSRILHRALELERRAAAISAMFRATFDSALVLAWTGQVDAAHDQFLAVRKSCIDRGDEGERVFVSFHYVLNEIWRADFAHAALVAEDTVEQAMLLQGALQLSAALTARAMVAAYVGQEHDARRDVSQATGPISHSGSRLLTAWTAGTLGFLELSLGNYQAAIRALEPLLGTLTSAPNATEIFVAGYVPDAAEAMINLGRLEDAAPLIDALERNGQRLDRAWMLATGGRCRGMLLAARGDLEAATAAVQEAMVEHDRLPMPFERARTQLLLGQLQRRQRQRVAAATTLRDALQTFEQLGTALWADRVRNEITRGTSGMRRADGLTPAEYRVAELAASGMTNKDIALTLFISPKTVDVNLSRIYRKLNIHSRLELYRKFESPTSVEPPKQ
jgi:DNA-binding CsgD family transcriptional regulator/tetratricopeptide (TPR) repeat protein